MSRPDNPFSSVALFWMVLVGIVSFAGMAAMSTLIGDGNYTTTAGANSFSRSAIGHKAFVEAMKARGHPVVVSQFDTQQKAWDADMLMLLEPQGNSASLTETGPLYGDGQPLLVLPKRFGIPNPLNSGWALFAGLLKEEQINKVLQTTDAGAEIIRPKAKGDDAPDYVPNYINDFNWPDDPEISDLQLIVSDNIEPIVRTEEGVLFGLMVNPETGNEIWVLSDPDVLSNHGLNNPANAAFMGHMLDYLLPQMGATVVDETIHGFKMDQSLARHIFGPPFVFPAIAMIVLIMAGLMLAARRFGPTRRAASVERDGLADFVGVTAGLFKAGKHSGDVTMFYVDRIIADVADRLHAPKSLAGNARSNWLDDIAARKGVKGNLRCRRFTEASQRMTDDYYDGMALREKLAQDVYIWKQEMLNAN
jgi:hypothetical protein